MNMPHPITDLDLMAYADGQLDDARRAAVEAWLAGHPEAAERVAQHERQNQAIGALFDPVIDEPVPARLDPAGIEARHSRARGHFRQLAAAAMVLIALGGIAGWFARDIVSTPDPQSLLIAEALDAHALYSMQNRHPVEVAGTEAPHLTAWLSNSLDRRLVAPDLTVAGYTLVGGRLLPAQTGPAAQLMYEDETGRRVTLYITPRRPADAPANRFAGMDGLGALYWANDAITCTIVGPLDEAELETLAGTVFAAFSPPGYRRS